MTSSNMNEKMTEIRNLEQEKRELLRELLDSAGAQKGHFLACGTQMGGTPSYITSVPMEWVAAKIRYAGQLPVFKYKSDPETHIIPVDGETVDLLQQRSPDWTRQIAMTIYLLARETHKFPPLLVVAYQDWVYDQQSDEWNGKVATKNSINSLSIDNSGQYFDLNTIDTQYYALDGQHRLMAIQGLDELMKKQRIQARKKNGTPISNKEASLDKIIAWLTATTNESENNIRANLEKIMSEKIGIEIMPAVVRGETLEKAVFRLRTLFVDVNENARKITKGNGHLLDEREGFRIIARRALINCPLLRKDDNKTKTNIDKMQLSGSDEEYTTLDTVVNITESYLRQFREFAHWANYLLDHKDFGKIRPNDQEINEGTTALINYFTAISKLPSHKRFIQGKSARKIRMSQGKGGEDYEDNVLFRPIAQMALAKALGSLVGTEETSLDGSTKILDQLIKKISRQENKGQLRLTDPKSPWFGVLYHPIDKKMRNRQGDKNLATQLFTYLLGGDFNNGGNQNSLKEDLWKARLVSDDEKTGYNFDGKHVKESEFDLPHPWQ